MGSNIHKREDTVIPGGRTNYFRGNKCRSSWEDLSRRISAYRGNFVWRRDSAVGRQKVIVADLRDKEKVSAWASRNAYLLIFLSCMFFITWTIFIVSVELN